MHVVESYATSCGVQIDKPYIYEKYFPMAVDRYITIDCDARVNSKLYHYWQEVIDLLLPVLKENDITLVQVGRKEDPPMVGTYDTRAQASSNQIAFILSRSLLHLGTDNFTADLASYYKTKNVCIFSNSLPEQSKPYWNYKKNSIFIQSPKDGDKPSYSVVEAPKTINSIRPNKIAEAVCKLLDIKLNFNYNYEHVGQDYHTSKANLIPDSMLVNYGLPGIPVSVRMDYLFNEQALAANLQTAKLSVVTNKPIDANLVTNLKSNIEEIIYLIEEDHDPNFIKFLLSSGVKYNLLSSLDEDKIQEIKIHYMDYGVISYQKKLTKEDVFKGIDKPLFYKSNKFILGSGKIYPSKSAWKRDIPTNSLTKQILPVIDDKDFWDDIGNYCILSFK